MLLEPLPTMNATAYGKATKAAVKAVVEAFGGADGTIELLSATRVNAMPYRAIIDERDALSKSLRDAVNDNNLSHFREAVKDVLRACQANSINENDMQSTLLAVQVLASFKNLDGDSSTWPQLLYTGNHISTTAKVFGYFDPTRWTTFHPRAVARLQTVLEPLVAANADLARLVAFPMPQDHAGHAVVPAWGHVRGGNEAKLSFLYLSWFLRHVATALSTDSKSDRPTIAAKNPWIDKSVPWKAHYVEMALAAAYDRAKAESLG